MLHYADRIVQLTTPAGRVFQYGYDENGNRTRLTMPSGAAHTTAYTVVDREAGQYLGHPTTLLLEDNKTMLIVYPKGHGRGGIVYKRSLDAGLTWHPLWDLEWLASAGDIHRMVAANVSLGADSTVPCAADRFDEMARWAVAASEAWNG